MAVIDISERLAAAKPVIKIAEGLEFEIDDDVKVFTKAAKLFEEIDGTPESLAKIKDALKLLLGADALKQIEAHDAKLINSLSRAMVIVKGVMAAVQGETLEAVEARFQG